jgi:hypothetical protein
MVTALFLFVTPAAADQLAAVQPSLPNVEQSSVRSMWRVSSGFDVSTGDYGAPESTTLSYAPIGISYSRDTWTFSIDTGYVDVTGPASYIDILDLGLTAEEAATLGLAGDTTTQGLDNVTLSMRAAAFDVWRHNLLIDWTAKVVVPTASRNKGLGTGAFDYAVGLDATKLAGPMTWFGTVGYRVRGGDASRRNSWSAGAGFSRAAGEQASWGLSYDARQTGTASRALSHDLTLFASVRLAGSSSVMAYASTGRPKSRTGTGVGLRFSYGFE